MYLLKKKGKANNDGFDGHFLEINTQKKGIKEILYKKNYKIKKFYEQPGVSIKFSRTNYKPHVELPKNSHH